MASATERAKDKIDAATSKVRKAGHNMADKAKRGAQKAGQKIKDLGRKIKKNA